MAKIIKYEELAVETKDALNYLIDEENAKDDPMTKSDELYLCQLELDHIESTIFSLKYNKSKY